MGRSYRQCTECGKRALSIATRCPACGRELSAPVVTEPRPPLELGRFLSPKLAAGALAAAVVLGAVIFGRDGRGSDEQSALTVSPAAASEVAYSAAPPADSPGELLVARTWTHVRNARRPSGDVEAVLLPGDTVLADSLSRGWYRVALEGEVLGYAHQSTLVAP